MPTGVPQEAFLGENVVPFSPPPAGALARPRFTRGLLSVLGPVVWGGRRGWGVHGGTGPVCARRSISQLRLARDPMTISVLNPRASAPFRVPQELASSVTSPRGQLCSRARSATDPLVGAGMRVPTGFVPRTSQRARAPTAGEPQTWPLDDVRSPPALLLSAHRVLAALPSWWPWWPGSWSSPKQRSTSTTS